MADLTMALQHLLKAARISGNKNSYKRDNAVEYGLVKTYIDGGPRPANVTTEMGLGLREVEDVRRGSTPPPPPANVAQSNPTAKVIA